MIDRTQKKLREATFFLSHLEREAMSEPRVNLLETIEFFLSAFLAAARSVTNVLESEAPVAYPAWSPVWRASLTQAERDLMADFTAARNRAMKRETPEVAEDLRTSTIRRQPVSSMPSELVFFFGNEYSPLTDRVLLSRLTPEAAINEILPHCREYLELLSRLVAAFQEAQE